MAGPSSGSSSFVGLSSDRDEPGCGDDARARALLPARSRGASAYRSTLRRTRASVPLKKRSSPREPGSVGRREGARKRLRPERLRSTRNACVQGTNGGVRGRERLRSRQQRLRSTLRRLRSSERCLRSTTPAFFRRNARVRVSNACRSTNQRLPFRASNACVRRRLPSTSGTPAFEQNACVRRRARGKTTR